MTTSHWIVCESGACWAAALRVTLARSSPDSMADTVVHETRTLNELSDRLAETASDLIVLEVRPNNMEVTLRWLAEQTRQPSRTPIVAVVSGIAVDRDVVSSALREAGAAEVVYSPRELAPAVRLGYDYHRCRPSTSNCGPAIRTSFKIVQTNRTPATQRVPAG